MTTCKLSGARGRLRYTLNKTPSSRRRRGETDEARRTTWWQRWDGPPLVLWPPLERTVHRHVSIFCAVFRITARTGHTTRQSSRRTTASQHGGRPPIPRAEAGRDPRQVGREHVTPAAGSRQPITSKRWSGHQARTAARPPSGASKVSRTGAPCKKGIHPYTIVIPS